MNDVDSNKKCANAERCWQNYVIIPGAISPAVQVGTVPVHANNGADRFISVDLTLDLFVMTVQILWNCAGGDGTGG